MIVAEATVATSLRLPPELYDRVTERASKEGLSRNEYIVRVLETAPEPKGRKT